MTDCSICGKPAATRAFVEGALLDVCRNCVGYGREVRERPAQQLPAVAEKQIDVVENYAEILRRALVGKSGEELAEFAKKLSVNADYIKQIESGKRVPDERTARKLESVLGIKLLKEGTGQEAAVKKQKTSSSGQGASKAVTLGDMIQIKDLRKHVK